MAINLPLLRELCEAPGAPGHEERVRDIVVRELTPLCDEVKIDPIGNVIARKQGSEGGRFMVSAHMDEIAFMVSHIDDQGFLHFVPLGGFDPKTLTAQRVIVHGRRDLLGVMGAKPIHIMTEEELKKKLELRDFYVDLGLPVDRVKESVRVGDVITRERDLVEVGDMVNGKAFDDRIGVFVMIEAMRGLTAPRMDVYAVGSVQEEVGIRGASVAAHAIDPDVGVALDVTLANDVPSADKRDYVSELGKGTAIKAADGSVICNWKLVAAMRQLCEDRAIPYQMEVMPRGGTDTAAIQRAGTGAAAGCVSVPTRYVHSVIEMVHPDDVAASIALTTALMESCTKDQFAL